MKRELRDRWVAALRSGEYVQGESFLRQGAESPRYCCLGVLCDVAQPDSWSFSQHRIIHPMRNNKEDSEELSIKACEDIGLPIRLQLPLTDMNDNTGKTFSEIADWIEANVPAEDGV